jgi:hypothetical protein
MYWVKGLLINLVATDVEPYGDWTKLGFPAADPSKSLNCSGILGIPECTKSGNSHSSFFHGDLDLTSADFFKRFGERPPVYAPYAANIVYSNAGWAIMGWVIEKVSGLPSGEFIKKHIWDPTGMNHTFFEEPDSSLGFVALNDVWWNATLGYGDP